MRSRSDPRRTDRHRAAARCLLDAYRTGIPLPPLTDSYDQLNVDDAYVIQQMQVGGWMRSGRRVVGHKVGLTSPAMQQRLGSTASVRSLWSFR